MLNYQQTLTEIVEKVKIVHVDPMIKNQDWTIVHPDYPPIDLEPEAIAKFQQMPAQLQRKYSIARIQNYLYDIYFSHSLMSIQEMAADLSQSQPVKNNVINGVDVHFAKQLQDHNQSRGYFDPGWQVVAKITPDELVVVKDGLHLYIDRSRHLPPTLGQTAINNIVPIYLPPQLVGLDTFIMVGDAGSPDTLTQSSTESLESVRIYFNFTTTAALEVAQQLTQALNQLSIPFQFAILHNPEFFYRYDSGTLWLSQTGYLTAKSLLAEIYQAHQADFAPAIPLFCQQLAPGLGLAEELAGAESFGMQRCKLLAIGLLTATEQYQTATVEKLQTICQEFSRGDVDLLHPYFGSTTNEQERQAYTLFG